MSRQACRKRYNEVLAFITDFNARNGYSPTYREIMDALGIRSSSTISHYIHRLIDDGELVCDESKPRTLTVARCEENVETVQQRICLEMADGGKLYMDCQLQKPKTAPVHVSFDGILDAKALKGRVGRIVSCNSTVE